jgi:hypothetical protein
LSSRNENGLINGDGDGRPPPEAIVVPATTTPAGAICARTFQACLDA